MAVEPSDIVKYPVLSEAISKPILISVQAPPFLPIVNTCPHPAQVEFNLTQNAKLNFAGLLPKVFRDG